MRATPAPTQLLFLPGALGDTSLWRAVDHGLDHPARRVHLGWPGFGGTPARADIQSLDDLVRLALSHIDQPTALIAQSMGGVIALRAALEAGPGLVSHLVLSVTSGGMGRHTLDALGAQDWRPALRQAHPGLPDWFATHAEDLSSRLPGLDVPALLLWGDSDPISPMAVGRHLADLIPGASMHVLPGGGHDLVRTHVEQVTPLIAAHLQLNVQPDESDVQRQSQALSPGLQSLDALLTRQFDLVAEPAHSGTWRTYFHRTIVRDPARSTRVLKVITDSDGHPSLLQLCASSDNNNAMLMPIPQDLQALTPLIQAEIQCLKDKQTRM